MTQAGAKILIMAGGTGGHVFPALATAKEMQKRGCHVEWLGTERGIESQLIPKQKITLHLLVISGVRGKGLTTLLLAPWKIFMAILQARSLLKKIKPDVVLGMGGYVAGPGGIAAKLLGIPLIIHEQNARPGTTNKWLAKIANRVLTAFPNVLQRGQVIGNPVREEIVGVSSPGQRFADRCGPIHLLILGGSLGAQAINQIMPAVLAELNAENQFEVVHQTGKTHVEETRQMYECLGVEAQVEAFIDNMALSLAWADLVVCRSGALTVSELSVVGVASILVPFPFAIDDHQTANANWLVSRGGAVLRQQNQLTVDNLKALIMEFSLDRNKLLVMAEAARSAALPDAAQKCADVCMEYCHA